MQRRHVLTTLAALTGWPMAASSQAGYPSKPIKLIVGFPPGVGIDFSARTIQPGLEAALGEPVVIDHKPGAGARPGLPSFGCLAPGSVAGQRRRPRCHRP